jgi:hypothetical protein
MEDNNTIAQDEVVLSDNNTTDVNTDAKADEDTSGSQTKDLSEVFSDLGDYLPDTENTNTDNTNTDTDTDNTDTDNTDKVGSDNEDQETKDEGGSDKTDLSKLYKEQLDKEIKLDKPIIVKVKGEVFDINDLNEARTLIEKGIDYTFKTQALAQERKLAEVANQYGINSAEDMANLLQSIQAQPTEPTQVSQVSDTTTVSTDTDTVSTEAEAIAQKIIQEGKAEVFRDTVTQLPPEAQMLLQQDARVLNGFYEDVKQGIASKILPLAKRYMAINGEGFLDAYKRAGDSIFGSQEHQNTMLTSEPKKVKRQSGTIVDDFSDVDPANDAEMERFYEKLKSKYKK